MAPRDRAAHEAYWRDVLDRHAASGLSLRAFAAREGLSANTLAYWKYTRLARSAKASTALVPVHVIDDRASSDQDITLSLDGVHVSIPRGFDEDHLAVTVTARPPGRWRRGRDDRVHEPTRRDGVSAAA